MYTLVMTVQNLVYFSVKLPELLPTLPTYTTTNRSCSHCPSYWNTTSVRRLCPTSKVSLPTPSMIDVVGDVDITLALLCTRGLEVITVLLSLVISSKNSESLSMLLELANISPTSREKHIRPRIRLLLMGVCTVFVCHCQLAGLG